MRSRDYRITVRLSAKEYIQVLACGGSNVSEYIRELLARGRGERHRELAKEYVWLGRLERELGLGNVVKVMSILRDRRRGIVDYYDREDSEGEGD